MSSAVYITCPEPISLEDWDKFCKKHHIEYSPQTVGRNVYYCGQVQVQFGEMSFKRDEPPETASKITVSTFHCSLGGNLESVAHIANLIENKFKTKKSCDPEFKFLLDGKITKEC